jgi:photosystem II stability/assembly factor-like uncharacterized protein
MFAGRVSDVAGVPGARDLLYVAHSTGGLFKSSNGGITFTPVFEDGNTLSVGAVALAPDNPDVIYVGTGEGAVRNSTSIGDGIYKSTDGGRTWKHLGLKDTERFARIIFSPKDSRIVFAAAMGHEWGPNEERGVFRSNDGGTTWKRVLYVNATTGASDVCFDGAEVVAAPGLACCRASTEYDCARSARPSSSPSPCGSIRMCGRRPPISTLTTRR